MLFVLLTIVAPLALGFVVYDAFSEDDDDDQVNAPDSQDEDALDPSICSARTTRTRWKVAMAMT